MSTNPQPTILFIDDVLEEIDPIAGLCEPHAVVLKRSFDDVEQSDLEAADLVLVDFNLKDWAARDHITELTLRPGDGLAVAETLRSYYRATKWQQPVAIAVLSGDLESLANPFPPTRREHMVASLAKLEWAFEKSSPIEDTARQLLSLANGVRRLPQSWPHNSTAKKDETLHNLLMMPDAEWTPSAIGDVSRCHPPIQELSTWSHGLAFLRWMLQRVLPYPTFLLDDTQVAIRLGVAPKSFCDSLQQHQEFSNWLTPALFGGVLHDFRGRRWWKAGIDALIWELTLENPFSKELLATTLKAKAPDVTLLAEKNPVACVDEDYEFAGVADAKDCVRLRPDDWPPFADSAWAKKDVVRNSESLRMAMEDAADQDDLEAKSVE